ncbi:MAG: CHAT domain-containing protein, partial [Patescibacteria group bacterium]|nr:CHAT domain-containing protein [Patescibacteria group bacterium]
AELAGILPQDRIVKINDLTTHGLELNEVLDTLRGEAEVPVTITVKRNQQEKSFHLIRTKIELSSPQRQAELLNTLNFFADSARILHQMSNENLTNLNALAENIARGKQSPVSALQSIPKGIGQQINKVKSETNAIIKEGKMLFNEQKEAVQEMEFLFSHIQKIENASNIDLLKEADEREKRMMTLVDSDNRLSSIEKDLFKSYCADVMLIHSSLPIQLEIEKNSISRMDIQKIFDENKKQSQHITSQFTDKIEMWRKRLIDDISIIQGDAERINALDKAQPIFEKAIKFLISFGEEKEALITCEKGKARAFADLLESKFPQKVLRKATDDLNIDELPDIPEELSIEGIEKMMKDFNIKSSSSVTLENLLEIIKNNGSTVVEYFLMEEQLVIWVVSPEGEIETKIVPIDKTELEATIHKATCLLSSPENSKKDREQLLGFLHRLYQMLILPIEDLLPTSTPESIDKVVTLIPHGRLFKVPFGALVTSLGDDIEKRPKYFIEAHPLAYSPSIEILNYTLQNEEQGVQKGTPNLLALVNPTGDHSLTERDVSQFNQFYPDSERNTIFKGKNATKNVLTQILESGSSYTTLYFGTHGFAFDKKPLESYLALSKSHLTAANILDLSLKTNLVVTGACQTALGEITGDGVNGLSRAFTYAGAPSLLISLWNVPEQQTFHQILLFHQYWLKERYSKAQALREAQMELIMS